MSNRTLFWSIFLIIFGLSLIAWKLGFAIWESIPFVYLTASMLISLGIFILLKKNIPKIVFLSIFSLILSFWILKIFDFECCPISNKDCNKVIIKYSK